MKEWFCCFWIPPITSILGNSQQKLTTISLNLCYHNRPRTRNLLKILVTMTIWFLFIEPDVCHVTYQPVNVSNTEDCIANNVMVSMCEGHCKSTTTVRIEWGPVFVWFCIQVPFIRLRSKHMYVLLRKFVMGGAENRDRNGKSIIRA